MKIDWTQFKNFVNARNIDMLMIDKDDAYHLYSSEGSLEIECELDKSASDTTDLDDFEANHKSSCNPEMLAPTLRPFAYPEFRTKIDGTISSITCAPNTDEYSDYLLTAERYLSGGQMIIKNAEFGDWICAAVYDKDSIIPEAYRSSLCEAWPIVNQYVIKMWIRPDGETSEQVIDTKPLNAKITAGLYLRIGYHASAIGIDRELVINYDLTVKL